MYSIDTGSTYFGTRDPPLSPSCHAQTRGLVETRCRWCLAPAGHRRHCPKRWCREPIRHPSRTSCPRARAGHPINGGVRIENSWMQLNTLQGDAYVPTSRCSGLGPPPVCATCDSSPSLSARSPASPTMHCACCRNLVPSQTRRRCSRLSRSPQPVLRSKDRQSG